MLNNPQANPFINFKARSLFFWLIIINIAIGIISGFIVSLIGFNIQDPIMTYVFYCLGFGLLCLWALRRLGQLQIHPKYVIGNLPNNYYWLPIVGIVTVLLLFSIGAALLSFHVLSLISPSLLESLLKSISDDNSKSSSVPILYNLLEIFSLIIVAPIVEEFIFRGILLHRWASKWGLIPAILVSSLIFGCLHINPVGLSLFGIVMSLLYIKTRTLIVPMVAHALNNTVATAMQFLSNGSNPSETIATSTNLKFAVVCLALSSPFIIGFIYKKWPRSDVALPYFANTSEVLPKN